MHGLFSNNCIFRYRFIWIFLIVLGAQTTHARGPASEAIATEMKAVTAVKIKHASHSIDLAFVSWQEDLWLSNSIRTEFAPANIFGNSLTYNYQNFPTLQHGSTLDFGFFSGSATQGGSQSALSYGQNKIDFTGWLFSYRYAYRMTKATLLSVGAIAVYRQLSWPTDSVSGVGGASGNSLNYGPIATLKLNLSDQWHIEQRLGTLMSHASTIWSLGFGYTF